MKVKIANPIYDTVFKYMMEDNAVAKLVVSSIIGEKVLHLEPKPQEHTSEKESDKQKENEIEQLEFPMLTVYRLDFSAKIATPEGYKVVIIEMQKASLPTDIMRFRRYLGEQYSDPDNRVSTDEGTEAMQIYSLYFLGKDLGICDTPVLSVMPEIKDVATAKIVKRKSEFIESLNHKCWIVQISCLKERRRTELEQLLSVFDQTNRTSDIHILNVREEDFPEKFRPIIRRLKMAASNPAIKKKMKEEDEVVKYLQDFARAEITKAIKEKDETIKEKDEAIMKKDETIKEKDETIKEKDETIKEKEQALKAEKAEKEAMQAKLEAAQAEKEATQKDTILNCHYAGLQTDFISSITGLTSEQINEILKQNGGM